MPGQGGRQMDGEVRKASWGVAIEGIKRSWQGYRALAVLGTEPSFATSFHAIVTSKKTGDFSDGQMIQIN